MIKYIIRDNVYDESFFDEVRTIMSKYWNGAVDTDINGIILSDDKIDIALVNRSKKKESGGEWFHSIPSHYMEKGVSVSYKHYNEVYSLIMGQMRSGKLEEIGI